MGKRLAGFVLLCLCGLQVSVAQPAHEAQVRRGQHVAELLCGACHLVIRNQEFPPFLKIQTPSFYEIAARPDTTAKSLRHFITSTHWDERTIPMTMPNQQLTPEQLNAVVAYILSLRPGS